MARTAGNVAGRLDFGELPGTTAGAAPRSPAGRASRLRLAPMPQAMTGPEKLRILDLKRRRAQIRARRVLGLK